MTTYETASTVTAPAHSEPPRPGPNASAVTAPYVDGGDHPNPVVISPGRRMKAKRQARGDNTAPRSKGGTTESASKMSKTDAALKLLRRKTGASLSELQESTGWQAHSVRGFLSGTVKKKLGLELTSEMGKQGVRRYRTSAASKAG